MSTFWHVSIILSLFTINLKDNYCEKLKNHFVPFKRKYPKRICRNFCNNLVKKSIRIFFWRENNLWINFDEMQIMFFPHYLPFIKSSYCHFGPSHNNYLFSPASLMSSSVILLLLLIKYLDFEFIKAPILPFPMSSSRFF